MSGSEQNAPPSRTVRQPAQLGVAAGSLISGLVVARARPVARE
jgi:hypothetical protein